MTNSRTHLYTYYHCLPLLVCYYCFLLRGDYFHYWYHYGFYFHWYHDDSLCTSIANTCRCHFGSVHYLPTPPIFCPAHPPCKRGRGSCIAGGTASPPKGRADVRSSSAASKGVHMHAVFLYRLQRSACVHKLAPPPKGRALACFFALVMVSMCCEPVTTPKEAGLGETPW